MDTRDGTIYKDVAEAKAAGVPDEDLVTGSKEALEKLREKMKRGGIFRSFKNEEK